MDHNFEIIWADLIAVFGAWRSLTVSDLALTTGIILWSVLLFLPLRQIDRRDMITGITYVLFCMAAGVLLVFALPKNLAAYTSTRSQTTILLIMTFMATLRWNVKLSQVRPRQKSEKLAEKEPET